MSLVQLGQLAFDIVTTISSQFSTKSESEKLYKALVPALKQSLNQGEPFHSKQVQQGIQALLLLPPNGARKLNFEKRYLINEYTVVELPDDPDQLSIAYWW